MPLCRLAPIHYHQKCYYMYSSESIKIQLFIFCSKRKSHSRERFRRTVKSAIHKCNLKRRLRANRGRRPPGARKQFGVLSPELVGVGGGGCWQRVTCDLWLDVRCEVKCTRRRRHAHTFAPLHAKWERALLVDYLFIISKITYTNNNK